MKPVILVGQAGLSDSLLAETDSALSHHELIKVRLRNDDREQRQEMAKYLCEKLSAELVQSMGQIVTLYRRAPQTPAPARPKARRTVAKPKKPAGRIGR